MTTTIQDIGPEWVATLRSNEFAQGTGALHHTDPDKYCCLGVLCEIHPAVDAPTPNSYSYKEETETGILPARLARDLGVTTYGTLYINNVDTFWKDIESLMEKYDWENLDNVGHYQVTLVDLNDGGLDFNGIASVIELALQGEIVEFMFST